MAGADPQLELLFSFYEKLHRKAPGSEESTRKALSLLDGLPLMPRIVEFGCGSGAASLLLARASKGSVTAVDIHQPFLDRLDLLAYREGLADRITTFQADMAEPPFPDHSFDLVWSEGAIYNVGVEQGLKRWRRLLDTGGFVAFTEVTWLSDKPPQKAVDFWATEYPAMTNIEDNQTKVQSSGFEPLGSFPLPASDWEHYYLPLQERLLTFRSKHSNDAEAQQFCDSLQSEIDVWREYGSSFGYMFFLGRAV